MLSNNIAYKIISQTNKSVYISIDLLNWQEEKIGELQGMATSGSINIQGNSSVRRTCSLAMEVTEGMENITNASNMISINKKVRIKVGVSNSLQTYKDLGEIVWFTVGIFVLTGCSISRGIDRTSMSITAQDKMCLLDGSVSGILPGFVQLGSEGENEDLSRLTLDEIIYYAVVGLGEEDGSKVIINNIPKYTKTPMIYEGSETLYFTAEGNPTNEANAFRKISKGDYSGYILEPFYYPTELTKSPGETVTSILDSIKSVLGNFEYFYDVDGNFVFQEVQNYLNTSFTHLTELNTGDYIANFEKTPYVFSFKDKDIVNSYSNTPNWANIKNDFIVWGMAEETNPVMYHLVIDDKPNINEQLEDGKIYPWQQLLIDYGKKNPQDRGKYYGELSTKFPQIYDEENHKWKKDPNDFNYYFDMIDTKSVFGAFSVNSIGRRTIAVTDDKVGRLYPPYIPDYVILNAGDSVETNQDRINELNRQGQKFLILSEKNYNNHTQAPYSKDAFSVIREQLYNHTSFNESISMNVLPLYFLDANQRIEVYDTKSNIYGDYMINSFSIPLTSDGLMNIVAIKAQQRI